MNMKKDSSNKKKILMFIVQMVNFIGSICSIIALIIDLHLW